MNTIKYIFWLSTLTTMQILSLNFDSSIDVGPAWNQLYASEHFKIRSDNTQAKTILLALDNPCAIIDGKFNFTHKDLYMKLYLCGILGTHGIITINQTQQESPFAVLANLDGIINTNVFEAVVTAGKSWKFNDILSANLGAGFIHVKGKRPTYYARSNLEILFYDWFNGPIFELGFTMNITSCAIFSAIYSFSFGRVKAISQSLPSGDKTFYNFPLFISNSITVDGSYKIADNTSSVITLQYEMGQNFKKGCVKLPLRDAALFSDDKVYTFRSQSLILTFGLNYVF